MRAGARVHDRMLAILLEARVVPSPAQVVALLVVRGRAEPGGLGVAVRQGLEDDEALLPVGLVVVGAIERRAPVVHRIEEQVVEDDPRAFPADPGVVDHPGIAGSGSRRSGRTAAAAVPPGTRPRRSNEVTRPASTSRAARPTRASRPGASKTGASGRPRHRFSSTAFIGFGHEAQVLRVTGGRVVHGAETLQVEGAGRHDDLRLAQGRALEQVARLDERAGGHREEQLAVGEPQDRFEAAEQREIGVGQRHIDRQMELGR